MKVKVNWSVTESHSAVIEVDDDFDPAEDLADSIIAEEESSSSYVATTDRAIESWEVTA